VIGKAAGWRLAEIAFGEASAAVVDVAWRLAAVAG